MHELVVNSPHSVREGSIAFLFLICFGDSSISCVSYWNNMSINAGHYCPANNKPRRAARVCWKSLVVSEATAGLALGV